MKRAFVALIAALGCVSSRAAEIAFGPSARAQSYAASLRGSGVLAPEIAFISEGRQPDRIPNINRVLMLNAVATATVLPRLQIFATAGLASSRYSTNGSGNGYRNPGKPGYDVGLGATYWLTPQWGLRLEALRMHHQQSDVPRYETFTQTTAQIVYRTGRARPRPQVAAQNLSLDLNTTCMHTRTYARDHLNQVNPGLGLTYTFNPDWSASAGVYRNSFQRTSGYVLANWTPVHLNLLADLRVSAGLTAGVLSGYTQAENPLRPFAAGAIVQLRTKAGWGINLVGVPNSRGGSGFVGLQLVTPL